MRFIKGSSWSKTMAYFTGFDPVSGRNFHVVWGPDLTWHQCLAGGSCGGSSCVWMGRWSGTTTPMVISSLPATVLVAAHKPLLGALAASSAIDGQFNIVEEEVEVMALTRGPTLHFNTRAYPNPILSLSLHDRLSTMPCLVPCARTLFNSQADTASWSVCPAPQLNTDSSEPCFTIQVRPPHTVPLDNPAAAAAITTTTITTVTAGAAAGSPDASLAGAAILCGGAEEELL